MLESKWADAPDPEPETKLPAKGHRKSRELNLKSREARFKERSRDENDSRDEYKYGDEDKFRNGLKVGVREEKTLLDRIDQSYLQGRRSESPSKVKRTSPIPGVRVPTGPKSTTIPTAPHIRAKARAEPSETQTKSQKSGSLLDRIDKSFLNKSDANSSRPSTSSSSASSRNSLPGTAQTTPASSRPASKGKPIDNKAKMELLKKKIEEQKKVLQERTHKAKQKELLAAFLEGDDEFQWDDEQEEEELINRIKTEL
ncbi:Gfd1p [Nakaseomyces bracarensis]|uniref:Gfd1p n=1 Tax=Nakaseomyces bracarensis TaxID=273131 RepID=UPI0038727818